MALESNERQKLFNQSICVDVWLCLFAFLSARQFRLSANRLDVFLSTSYNSHCFIEFEIYFFVIVDIVFAMC